MRLALAALWAAGCASATAAPPTKTGEAVVTLIGTAEIKGTPEPCGCTSDPLGDVARVATLAKEGLWLDAGGLLYDPESLGVEKRPQADATAAVLARVLQHADVGLGAGDLARGREHLAPQRLACNVRGLRSLPPRLHEVGKARVGVFGVVAPERVRALGVDAAPAAESAKQVVAELKKQGAQVIVALCGMSRPETRALLKAVRGIDLAIVGAEVGDGMAEPEPVGDSFLVAPADQARYVAQLELHLGGGGRLSLYAGAAARARAHERTAKRIASLEQSLQKWKSDAQADPAFVAARRDELKQLRADDERAQKPSPPPPSSYFTYALLPVRHVIARDPEVAQSLRELARTIGRDNLRRAQAETPPTPEPGTLSYVGMSNCLPCHKTQVAFWQKTVHAHAWETLIEVDKQYNYDCIGCHVSGWQRAGGPTLATVEKRQLTNVQCEVCHGPASKHVAESGMESPPTMVRRQPDRFCADNCHTKEHSDTFDLQPYLRDILGRGHGEKARARLGDGTTGHELRQKALQQAGRS